MINVTVTKTGSENSMSLVRRFSKRVLGAGIIRRVKNNRYRVREMSKGKRRASALRRVEKRAKNAQLERLGLIDPTANRRGGPRK
jgi:ribosomal protein S21